MIGNLVVVNQLFKIWNRKYEAPYKTSKFICEFWNTISSLPFIIIGILRLIDENLYLYSDELVILYLFFVFAGIFGFIHHMSNFKYTILLDSIPLISSFIYIFYNDYLFNYITLITWFKIFLAFCVFITDHLCSCINTPWGHVFWHLLITFALDSAYQDIYFLY
jgi:hypothetical protein